jgi:hypothetical protein
MRLQEIEIEQRHDKRRISVGMVCEWMILFVGNVTGCGFGHVSVGIRFSRH